MKMNKFLLVITPIVVFIFTTFLCFSTYWLGGGNFERGGDLGATFALSVVAGGLLSSLAWDLLNSGGGKR